MAMGICSDENIEKELSKNGINKKSILLDKKEVPASPAIVENIQKGRGIGKLEVPSEIRRAVALTAINKEGSAKDIAETFNVSPSSVSAYKVGSHSTTT